MYPALLHLPVAWHGVCLFIFKVGTPPARYLIMENIEYYYKYGTCNRVK